MGYKFGGKLIQKLRQKEVYEEVFMTCSAWIGGKLIQFMLYTIVPNQVKTKDERQRQRGFKSRGARYEDQEGKIILSNGRL